jgi:hypothetical protein
MYRQFDLRHLTDDHEDYRLTCWLRDDARLRPGALVTLREDDEQRHWEVVRRGLHALPDAPRQPWRVGGLL